MDELDLAEEELLLKNTVREFVDKEIAPRAAGYDESGHFPWDNIRGMAGLGLLGLTINEEYGGSGGTTLQLAIAVEEIARGCASTSVIYLAHLSLCTQLIHTFGTESQKRKFIPRLTSGEKIGAFALTEPSCGSDAVSMRTTVTESKGSYLLNGSKTFITNAKEADVFVVFATRDPSLRAQGIEALVVEKGSTGLIINPQNGKMGMRASSTAEVIFKNCPVLEGNLLGEKGQGFGQAMVSLDASRISTAAQAVGIAQAAYENSLQYAKQRQAFGRKIAEFQAIQWMIADMATSINAARLLVYQAAVLRDKGVSFSTEASMAKLFASRVAVESADKSVQIHGGAGYFAPAVVERLYRDAKVTEIYEGSSEIQRLVIARSLLGL